MTYLGINLPERPPTDASVQLAGRERVVLAALLRRHPVTPGELPGVRDLLARLEGGRA